MNAVERFVAWLDSLAGPLSLTRYITIAIAAASLLVAAVSFLQTNAADQGGAAARNAERYAVLTATDTVTGQARLNYDYYGAFKVWQDLNYQAIEAAVERDTARALRFRTVRDAVEGLTPLLTAQYTTQMEEPLRGYYLGLPDRWAYEADLYLTAAAETDERYALASRQRAAWSAKGSQYIRNLGFLGVALLLLGLATTLPRSFQKVFFGVGTAVTVGCAVWAASVYLDPIPTLSEEAIKLYAQGEGNFNKYYDYESKLDEAIENYGAAIALEPKYAHAYLGRANALVTKGDDAESPAAARPSYDRALDDYRKAIQSDKTDVTTSQEARAASARLLYTLGDLEAAAAFARDAIEVNPTLTSARFELGLALLARGDEAAEEEFRRAIDSARIQVEAAFLRGEFASPVVWFDMDKAARNLEYLQLRLDSGDKASNTAPPLASIPESARAGIRERSAAIYTSIRNEAIAMERRPPEYPGPPVAASVTGVYFATPPPAGEAPTRRAIFPSQTKEVVFGFTYSGIAPRQRLTLRMYEFGLESNQLRQEITWTAASSGEFQLPVFFPGRLRTFTPGTYKAELYVENQLVAGGTFNVLPDAGVPLE